MATCSILLLAVLYLGRQAAGAARCTGTTATGELACDDSCNEVGRCLGGVWQRSQNCQASGLVCRRPPSGSATCVDNDNSYCHSDYDNTLTCGAGVKKFPSLLDCTSYYVCETGVATAFVKQCPGTAYNSCKKTCGDPLTNGVCPNSSTFCSKDGQVGLAPGYDGLYYTCVIGTSGFLQPEWKTCGSGARYSLTAKKCEPVSGVVTCTVCAGATTVPSTQPNPFSICSYFVCHSRENFELRQCRSGWYYVHSERGCIWAGGSNVC